MMEHYWRTLPGPNWFSGGGIFVEQVKRAADGAVFVELGAWKGRSAAFMGVEIANSGKNITFFTVDHWEQSTEEKAYLNDEDAKAGRLYETFLANIAPVRDYVRPLRSDSAEAARLFDDGSVDFLYVDASHSYAGASRDLAAWWPKLKKGGVIAGDDWLSFIDGEYGVRRAVQEFFDPKGLQIHVVPGYKGSDWEQWLVCNE